MGGTFDPIHLGHLVAAEEALVQFNLDRVLFMPTGQPAFKADEVVTHLVKALDGIVLTPLHTAQSPAAAMSAWLTSGEAPSGFSVDRECELKSPDESKSAVRYARHALDIDEVRQHIALFCADTQPGELQALRTRTRELSGELERLTDVVHRDEVARAEQNIPLGSLVSQLASVLDGRMTGPQKHAGLGFAEQFKIQCQQAAGQLLLAQR